jgi:hypothetical protein
MKNITTVRRRALKIVVIILFIFGLSIGMVRSYSTGPPVERAGVPAGHGFPEEETCDSADCHDTFRLNPDTRGKITIAGLPDNYVPGRRYSLTLSVTHPDPDRIRWGFETTAVAMDTFIGAGNFVVTDRAHTQMISGGPPGNRSYIEHNAGGTAPGTRGGNTWRFDWMAPSANVGDVGFFGSGNAADADGSNQGDKIYNSRPNPVALTRGQYTFTNVAAAANVAAGPGVGAVADFDNVAAGSGGGVAVGDYDKDGRPDLFIARDGQDALYHNNGDGTFTDVAVAAGIVTGDGQGRAAAWGDYDGDGRLDLYVVNGGADRLYHNNGDQTFSDVTGQVGISDNLVGHGVVWADFTGSHRLDLYVANEGQDILYFNNGDGTFTKADPAVAGMTETAAGWSVAVTDYNGDGKPDIFVANDGPDFLYKNNGGGTFTNVATAAGIQTASAQGRAAVWLDFDKDGKVDVFIANVGQDLLYKNNGNETFTDVTATAGLVDNAVGMAADWGDYDGDGYPDLFVANEGQDFLYRNNRNGTFNQVATVSGMTDMAAGRGAAWVDFNKDGNIDLFVANATGGNFLYKNPGRSGPAPATAARQANIRGEEYLISAIVMVSAIWKI